jgi:hypothetical protein
LIGTSASIAGGAIIGATMALDLWLEKGMCLVTSWEYSVLNEAGRLVVYGAIAGALGSFVHVKSSETHRSFTEEYFVPGGFLVGSDNSSH